MDKLKLLIPIIFILLNSGCASFGPTVRIETPEPAEDFIVKCKWVGSRGIIAGSGSEQSHKVFVTESGKEVDCGLGFSSRNGVQVMHPLYWGMSRNVEDGITVYRYTGTKLDYLDKQKKKFEAGYWGKSQWPGSQYANSIKSICGFGHQYFYYYHEVKKIDYDYFKETYYDQVLNCYKKILPVLKKYDKSYKNVRSAEKYIEKNWRREYWEKYNDK